VSDDFEARIIECWHRNVGAWSAAVRERRIESRALVTDQAIIGAVLERAPHSVLDLGCGEGWLARTLAARGIQVLGIDAVADLIERARAGGGGEFRVATYEQAAAGLLDFRADVAVCNFSLLGCASVDALFAGMARMLAPHGAFMVQTLHPKHAGADRAHADRPYQDGWREGSWSGFGADFTDPAPWYFRTLESWEALFQKHGLRLLARREPLHPHTLQPTSVIFIAEVMG